MLQQVDTLQLMRAQTRRKALGYQPDIPWDLAVADIARKALHEKGSS